MQKVESLLKLTQEEFQADTKRRWPAHPIHSKREGRRKKMEVGEAHTFRPRCSGLFSDASPKKWVLLVERKVKAE